MDEYEDCLLLFASLDFLFAIEMDLILKGGWDRHTYIVKLA